MIMNCPFKSKWSGIHYKGESYLRFPTKCLLCENMIVCEEIWREMVKIGLGATD